MKKIILLLIAGQLLNNRLMAEDGYDLWLRYNRISNTTLLANYKKQIQFPAVVGNSATLAAARVELNNGLSGLLGIKNNCSTIASID